DRAPEGSYRLDSRSPGTPRAPRSRAGQTAPADADGTAAPREARATTQEDPAPRSCLPHATAPRPARRARAPAPSRLSASLTVAPRYQDGARGNAPRSRAAARVHPP